MAIGYWVAGVGAASWRSSARTRRSAITRARPAIRRRSSGRPRRSDAIALLGMVRRRPAGLHWRLAGALDLPAGGRERTDAVHGRDRPDRRGLRRPSRRPDHRAPRRTRRDRVAQRDELVRGRVRAAAVEAVQDRPKTGSSGAARWNSVIDDRSLTASMPPRMSSAVRPVVCEHQRWRTRAAADPGRVGEVGPRLVERCDRVVHSTSRCGRGRPAAERRTTSSGRPCDRAELGHDAGVDALLGRTNRSRSYGIGLVERRDLRADRDLAALEDTARRPARWTSGPRIGLPTWSVRCWHGSQSRVPSQTTLADAEPPPDELVERGSRGSSRCGGSRPARARCRRSPRGHRSPPPRSA